MDTRAPRRGRRTAATLLCVAGLLAACGSDDAPGTDPGTPPVDPTVTTQPAPTGGDPSSPSGETASEEARIVISDFTYEVPGAVPPGAEVTVTNEDTVGHTVTSDDEGRFDVAVEPGATVTFTAPEEPGEYGFFCIPHPHMTATLVVG